LIVVDYKGLTIRKLADKSEGERVTSYDPATDQKYLVNPATGKAEPWPLLGIKVEGEAPSYTMLSTKFVTLGVAEGWIEIEGERVVHRPGGPASDPWRVTHTFVHADAIIIKTVDGDVRYEVHGEQGQPDKYDKGGDPVDELDCGDPDCTVEKFYNLKLVKNV
jgi:hypothetical protein